MTVRRLGFQAAVGAIAMLPLSGMQAQSAPAQGQKVTLKPGEVLPYNPDGIGRKGTGKASGYSFFQAERENIHIDAATKAALAKMPGAGNIKK